MGWSWFLPAADHQGAIGCSHGVRPGMRSIFISWNFLSRYNQTSLFHLRIFAYTSVLLLRWPLEMSPKRSLIKSCLGSLRLLAVCLMRLWLWPLKLPAPPSQPLLLSLQGEGWGHYETQWSALRGCLRRELRGTVCISRRSRNPTRHLEEFTRGEGRQRGWRDAVDSCTLLKTVNLEKWGQQHAHGCVLFFK